MAKQLYQHNKEELQSHLRLGRPLILSFLCREGRGLAVRIEDVGGPVVGDAALELLLLGQLASTSSPCS